MDKKKLRHKRGNRDQSKFLVILALGGAAVAVGLLSFISYKQFYVRRVKSHQLQKRTQVNNDDYESESEEEEEENVKEVQKTVKPPTTISIANENKIKWWSEIANEQRNLGDVKSSRFYALKAIDEMSLDPKFENSMVMIEMKFILGTTVKDEEEKEKLLTNLLSTMDRLGEDVSDEKYYEIKGSIYKDMSDIYFTKEKYVEAKEFSTKCYDNFKKGFANRPNRLESGLAVAKYSLSTINEKLNDLEESEADALEAYQHAVHSKNFQLILHISNHRTDILTKLGRIDDAIASLKEQIADDSFEKPTSFLANRHHLLATLLYNDQDNIEEAIENLKESISIYANYYPAMSLLVSCYYELGQEDEARKISDTLIKSYDLTLSQSKYFITAFMSFTSEKEGEPFIFFIQLKMKRNRAEELIIKPGSFIELNIRKFYKSDEQRPEDEPLVAETQTYTIVGDEEEDTISLGADLLIDHNDSDWYEMIVKVYEDESKENQIGVHYQLITTTITTIKQYDKMQKWLNKRKEQREKVEEENEKENVEDIVAEENEDVVEQIEKVEEHHTENQSQNEEQTEDQQEEHTEEQPQNEDQQEEHTEEQPQNEEQQDEHTEEQIEDQPQTEDQQEHQTEEQIEDQPQEEELQTEEQKEEKQNEELNEEQNIDEEPQEEYTEEQEDENGDSQLDGLVGDIDELEETEIEGHVDAINE